MRKLGRLEESAAAAREALRLRPRFAEAALNLGTALLKLDRCDEALAAYEAAGDAQPGYGAAFNGQALALRALGRLEEASAAFDSAIALGNREAISGRGCLDLMLGDFERGWEGYEARWVDGKSLADALGARFPTWRGPGRAGERVLVMNDHGFGDTIQFCRYLPLMTAAGAEPTFLCPPRLHRLMSSLTGIRLVAERPPGERFDAQIAVSSLPRAFATRLDNVPASVPYLAAEPERARKWAARIGAEGFKIGIVWQGNPNPEADMARSAPLAAFAPLAAIARRQADLAAGWLRRRAARRIAGRHARSRRSATTSTSGPTAFVDTAAAMARARPRRDLRHFGRPSCRRAGASDLGRAEAGRRMALAARPRRFALVPDHAAVPPDAARRLERRLRRDGGRTQGARPVGGAGRTIDIPGAVGELIDKIAILRIKARRIDDPDKLANVRRELALLTAKLGEAGIDRGGLSPLETELAAINENLWDVEDEIRLCEKAGDFGERFVALARTVYVTNDRRAAIKREINRRCNSAIVEEKHYA